MATHDKPIQATCPACLAQEEADMIFGTAIESGRALKEMVKRNFDYLWSKHTSEPGCAFYPRNLDGRTLPCGCLSSQVRLPRRSDGTCYPDAVRWHVRACKVRELTISRSSAGTTFKGIETPDERRPDWFWELWVRRPLTPGSADDLQEEGDEFGDDLE